MTDLRQFLTDEELLIRLNSEEDNFVERKPSANFREVRRAVVAFANAVRDPREGVLFLGVSDKTKEPTGKLGDVEKTQRNVRNWIDECYPPIPYYARVLTIEAKDVLAIIVTESRVGPHFAGPAFVRVGAESKKASEEILQRLVEDRLDSVRRLREWEGKIVTIKEESTLEAQFQARQGRPFTKRWATFAARLIEVNPHWIVWQSIETSASESVSTREILLSWDTSGQRRLVIKVVAE